MRQEKNSIQKSLSCPGPRQFTLIEILVVVAIIGILSSLLLPALGKARTKAKQTVCVSQLKQLGIALYNYLDDNDGSYPHTYKEGGNNNNIVSWDDLISGYDGRASLTPTEMKQSLNANTDNQLYICPNDTTVRNTATWPTRSYSIVSYQVGDNKKVGISASLFADLTPRKITEINNTSETISLTEFFSSAARMGAHYGTVSGVSHYQLFLNPEPNNPIAHDNKYNYLFIDGHVSALSPIATFLDESPNSTNAYNTMWDAGR